MGYRMSVLTWILIMMGFATIGISPVVAQTETIEKLAVVYSCETPDCSDADGVKDPMSGATVTSIDASGTEIAICTTNEYGQCALLVPVAEDGTYAVVAGPGFERYVLLSREPESTGERGDGREWTFVPVGEVPGEEQAVNVVYCDDPACAEPMTMEDAVVESYRAGELTDSCTISSAAHDFDGCRLLVGADQVGFEIIPAAAFEKYVLVSDEPEVYEIDRGDSYQLLLWTFVPADEAREVSPGESEKSPETDELGEVTDLPSTGAGPQASTISRFSR